MLLAARGGVSSSLGIYEEWTAGLPSAAILRTFQGLVPAFAVAWLPCAGWRSAPAAVAPPQPARIWRFGCRLKSLTLRAWVERLYGSADVGCALPLGSGGDAGRGTTVVARRRRALLGGHQGAGAAPLPPGRRRQDLLGDAGAEIGRASCRERVCQYV